LQKGGFIQEKSKEIVLKPVRRTKIKPTLIPAKKLKRLEGIFSLGGNAMKDSEDLSVAGNT